MHRFGYWLLALVSVVTFGWACASLPEHPARAFNPLVSVPATNLYAISQSGMTPIPGGAWYQTGQSGGWLANGITFCDHGPGAPDRCVNEPTASLNYHSHGLMSFDFTGVDCPVFTSAKLLLTTRTYDGNPKWIDIRRVLVDWTATTEAACANSNGVQTSATVGWRYRKPGVEWAQWGASLIGTDVSNFTTQIRTSPLGPLDLNATIPDGITPWSVDITTLVSCWFDGSCPNYGLMLRAFNDENYFAGKHIGIVSNTWALALDCGSGMTVSASSSSSSSGSGGMAGSGGTSATSGGSGGAGTGGVSVAGSGGGSTTTTSSIGGGGTGCL